MAGKDVNEKYRIPDEIWEQIRPLLPPKIAEIKNEHPWMDDRKAMEAILHVFRKGCEGKTIPCKLAKSVYSRFQEWRVAGVFQRMWRNGLLEYDELRAIFWYGRRKSKS